MESSHHDKLMKAEMLMGEIQELLQYYKDLRIERDLLIKDLEILKEERDPKLMKLYSNYF